MTPTAEALTTPRPQPASLRDGRGRWRRGTSGNAAGKAPGTRNRATILRERLGEDATEAALDRSVQTLVERVGEGHWSAAAVVLGALAPNARGRPIDLGLPDDADDLTVMDEILRRTFSGDITLEEAQGHVRLLERRRALRAEAAGRRAVAAVAAAADGIDDRAPEPAARPAAPAPAARPPKPARRTARPEPRQTAPAPASGLHLQAARGPAGPAPDPLVPDPVAPAPIVSDPVAADPVAAAAIAAVLAAARPPAPGPVSRASLSAGTARIRPPDRPAVTVAAA